MVETIRLESGHTLTGIVGSNPTLSARFSGQALPHSGPPGRLEIERDPCRGVVARVLLTSRPSVNTGVHEAV